MTPTKPGFYWAKWKIATPETHEGKELTPCNSWNVVEVWANTLDAAIGREPQCEADAEIEPFGVSVPGVRETQWPDQFFWGEGPLPEPGARR